MLVEGVHFLARRPARDVAWKLVAVNLSDLAAKGARRSACCSVIRWATDDWDQAFAKGLARCSRAFGSALARRRHGGVPAGAPRALGLTAIGRPPARCRRERREAGRPALGQRHDRRCRRGPEASPQRARSNPHALIERYRNPRPRLEAGARLAPLVTRDDGRLRRPAARRRPHGARRAAAGPRSSSTRFRCPAPISRAGRTDARIDAATAGDDYELLFAAPAGAPRGPAARWPRRSGFPCRASGRFDAGTGLALTDAADRPCPIVSASHGGEARRFRASVESSAHSPVKGAPHQARLSLGDLRLAACQFRGRIVYHDRRAHRHRLRLARRALRPHHHQQVLSASAGNERMQDIAAAIQEGAQGLSAAASTAPSPSSAWSSRCSSGFPDVGRRSPPSAS